jgi:hypothetical protein
MDVFVLSAGPDKIVSTYLLAIIRKCGFLDKRRYLFSFELSAVKPHRPYSGKSQAEELATIATFIKPLPSHLGFHGRSHGLGVSRSLR